MLCILQPYLLTMTSKSSTGIIIIIIILITTKQNLMPPVQSTAHGKREPDIPVTSSTPKPTPTFVVLKLCGRCSIISASSFYRRMLI